MADRGLITGGFERGMKIAFSIWVEPLTLIAKMSVDTVREAFAFLMKPKAVTFGNYISFPFQW